MTLSYTNRFKLAIPDFLSEPWHAEFAQAMQSIDDALFGAIIGVGGTLWENSTPYAIGDIVIDPDSGGFYSASVTHTSNTEGVFADDIANWTAFALVASTQIEAEEGTTNTSYMTPLRVSQAIDAQSPTPGVATELQAQTGTNNTEMMTPLRTTDLIAARLATEIQAEVGVDDEALMTPLRTTQLLEAVGIVGGTQVGFHAHKNAVNQTTISTGTPTKVTFDTEFYDLGSRYDTANSRWTPTEGLIHIDAAVSVTTVTADTGVVLTIYKNGAPHRSATVVTPTTSGSAQISLDDSANVTDYYELYVTVTTGTNATVLGAVTGTWFMGHFLGETGTITLGHEELGFRAHKNSVSQTGITTGLLTKITFGTEVYDQGGFYDTAQSRWTPSAGMIHIDIMLNASNVTTANYVNLHLYKNGVSAAYSYGIADAGGFISLTIDHDDVASGTDYYEVFASAAGSWTATGQTTSTYFSGHRVGGPQGEEGDAGPTGPAGTVTGAFGPPQGRLTLTTLTPVMTATVSAGTTIYYAPYVGDQVPVYDSGATTWSMMSIGTQISRVTSDPAGGPAVIGASKVNDWFVWDNGGTVTLSHGPDWTSDTVRGAGAGTTELTRLRGIRVNAVNITNGPSANEGTYVGTTRSNGSSQLTWIYGGTSDNGTAGVFGLWNAYNRIEFKTFVRDSATSWFVPATTVQSRNGSVTNRVSIVAGWQEDYAEAKVTGLSGPWSGGSVHGVGIGYNSTSAISSNSINGGTYNVGVYAQVSAFGAEQPFGYVFFQALDVNGDSGTVVYYGDLNVPTYLTGGMMVSFRA